MQHFNGPNLKKVAIHKNVLTGIKKNRMAHLIMWLQPFLVKRFHKADKA